MRRAWLIGNGGEPQERLGDGMIGEGDARVKAAREMPRPCVGSVVQAQGTTRFAKSGLTSLSRRKAYHC